jgi:hypothetical protein
MCEVTKAVFQNAQMEMAITSGIGQSGRKPPIAVMSALGGKADIGRAPML